GGLFCFRIAMNVTLPLYALRAAAASIAEGRLDTRVGKPAESGAAFVLRKHPETGDEITALKRDFDHMAERLAALVAGQRRLLGEASHELRSPLARLTVALGLAKQHPEEASEHLERIALEAQHLDKLVGQLLTLSRIEGQVDVARAEFDLTNLIH